VNALEKISGSILGWSGGTNIGRSLHTFNRNFAPSMVTHRTVVVIISDGWDRGDVSVLEREPDIGDENLIDVLSSNLCRCTGYQNIIKAVRAAAKEMRKG